MSVYTINHIINEVIDERGKMTSTKSANKALQTDAKVEIYWETWTIMNAWIEGQLAKKAGATAPLLGSFTWEDRGGLFRPIFLLSEHFIKTYHVKQQKSHKKLNTMPCEDINYSKLAIKYSTNLTKDLVFTGVRDIIKKISSYFERGYETEIEFSFGIMKLRDRRVKFEFNQGRLKKIMPSNAFDIDEASVVEEGEDEEEVLGEKGGAAAVAAVDLYAEPQNSYRSNVHIPLANTVSAKAAVPKLDTSIFQNTVTTDTANNNKNNGSSIDSRDNINNNNSSRNNNNYNNSNSNDDNNSDNNSVFYNTAQNSFSVGSKTFHDRPISPGLERVLKMLTDEDNQTLVGNKAERRKRLVEKCTEDSYMRMLATVENIAANEDDIKLKAFKLQKEWIESEKKKNENGKNSTASMKATLDTQVNAHNQRMAADRQNRISAISNCIIKETVLDDDKSPASIARQKMLQNELLKQINTNMETKTDKKLRTLLEEKEYLDHVAMEIDMQYAAERSAHLEKQRTLLEAWEREGHIRNLKKLQSYGANTISDYVNTNLGVDTSSFKKDMSIGFDARQKALKNTKVGGNSFGFEQMIKSVKK